MESRQAGDPPPRVQYAAPIDGIVAAQVQAVMKTIPGIVDLQTEKQVLMPQATPEIKQQRKLI